MPFWRRIRRPLLWVVLVAYFAFAGIFLSLRYYILPHIADYQQDIAQILTQKLQLPVSIATIEADWSGLRPRLTLKGLVIADQQQRPALELSRVEAIVGWRTLLHAELRLHRLEIDSPALAIRREADGKLLVAGLPVNLDDQDAGFSDWLLAQHQVVIRDASITWHDAQRNAPALSLEHVQLRLDNSGAHHRFALLAEPPKALAARLDIRGDFKGRDLDVLESWKGQIYAELDYADLAVWRQWVDYPIDLPQGSGGLRLWLNFAQKQINGMTADVSLEEVRVRLGKSLPMLDIKEMQGRLSAQRQGDDVKLEAKGLSLMTRNGLQIEPVDFSAQLLLDRNDVPQRVEANFNRLDLGKLDALSTYLPLPPAQAALLEKLELEGIFTNFSTRWDGQSHEYRIKGDFQNFSVAPYESIPGLHRLSGRIDGTHKGGTLLINSQNAGLSMPTIFPIPDIALDTLEAKLGWQRSGDRYDVRIEQMRFANADAAGTLQGLYKGQPGTAGSIDLTGQLSRGNGTTVWRYLPFAVGKDSRDWVRTGITAGQSHDVKLTLKGDLAKFPFRDGSGVFKVIIKAENATIVPAPSWPQISGIHGSVSFIGEKLVIDAQRGQIFGAQLSQVQAEIADLESETDQTLNLRGKARGATQEFLKFIEASPVGERINHFTAPMQAGGEGELDLAMKLTLHNIDDSTVHGRYHFENNRVSLLPALPPLTEARAVLEFTGDGISMKDGRFNVLGAPATLNINTGKDGQIDVQTEGQLSIAALKKQRAMPILDQLSGTTRWKGLVNIRKNDVDLRFTSDLVGITSSLPEPLNKTAASAMDFKLERRFLPQEQVKGKRSTNAPRRELAELQVGKWLRSQMLQVQDGVTPARGFLALGAGNEALRLPEKGVTLAANVDKLDVDFWRRMASLGTSGTGTGTVGVNSGSSSTSANDNVLIPPPTQLDLRTGELVFMNRSLRDVRFNAQQTGRNWKGDFRSKGVSASLEWQPGVDGKPGRIIGRIPQLSIPDPNQQVTEIASLSDDSLKELPSVSLNIDHLTLRNHDWGSVNLEAENRAGFWQAKVNVSNEDATLTSDVRWRPDQTQQDTALKFQLKAKSMEKLLTRAGYPDAVRRGTANLEGQLSWNAPPFSVDYPSLHGQLKLELENGQFKKLEPGIGRLLGVLSLQSLPRRITLDFRDIFSEGFAFDSIRGDVAVTRGVMETKELTLNGPAAKVRMNGSVSLPDETQNLHVRVQPALGETLAVGAMLANPAVGAIAWLTQKVLRDPIDQAFAFEYRVTGKWDDPQVAKLNSGRDINKEIADEVTKQGASTSKEIKDSK